MKQAIGALILLLALAPGAHAAMNCELVGFCQFTGLLDGLDCSTRECPLIIGLSDMPG
jgi:hypothetical protein